MPTASLLHYHSTPVIQRCLLPSCANWPMWLTMVVQLVVQMVLWEMASVNLLLMDLQTVRLQGSVAMVSYMIFLAIEGQLTIGTSSWCIVWHENCTPACPWQASHISFLRQTTWGDWERKEKEKESEDISQHHIGTERLWYILRIICTIGGGTVYPVQHLQVAKYSNHDITFTGIFILPVENLRDPPAYLRIRDLKDWYVDYLSTLLLNEDAEDLTAPFMVVASVSAVEFRAQKLNTYTYEVWLQTKHAYGLYQGFSPNKV